MLKRVSCSAANAKTELFTPSPQGQLAESADPNTGITKIVRNQLGQPFSVQQTMLVVWTPPMTRRAVFLVVSCLVMTVS
jgi:hypothetical protein